jgi:flagellar motor switch protein FliN/FliY
MSSSRNSLSSNELVDGRLQNAICRVELVLGTGAMSLRECLELVEGSILRLSQPAGGYLQVVANGVPLARGEVVMLDQSLALRITDILPPSSGGPSS